MRIGLANLAWWAVAIVSILIACLPWAAAELRTQDIRFHLRGPRPVSPEIVLVPIDEAAGKAWSEPIVHWGAHFSSIVRNLHKAGAKCIGLDFSFSADSDAFLDQVHADAHYRPNSDLVNAIFEARGSVVLARGQTFEPVPELEEACGNRMGLIDLSSLGDATIRAVPGASGRPPIPGFAEMIDLSTSPPHDLHPTPALIPINFCDEPYPTLSAIRVANGDFDDHVVRGKIVLVGTALAGSGDFHVTPFGRETGLQIQADALSSLLTKSVIRTPPAWTTYVIVILTTGGIAALIRKSSFGVGISSSLSLGAAYFGSAQWVFTRSNTMIPLFAPLLGVFAVTITGIALKGLQESLGRAKLRAQFGAFISEQVAAHLVDSEPAYGQVGEIKTATVMILDIRGFSPLSEQFGPVRTFTALNEFFDPILPIVDDEGGHISVFTGDGFLAVFGVPADLEAHAQRALRCARRIVEATKQMRQTHDIVFEIGIGIHTGDLLPGIVGSHDRHTFTVIGTTVNLSSRLQELTKELGCAIVISESSIIAGAPSDGLFGPISLNIRGNKEPICVYHD